MRLPGRLAAAIEILTEIETRHRPASEALKAWGLGNRFAGAGDRAAIGNLVYDGLRRRASHAYAMGEDTPRALVLAVAVFDWGETPDGLNAQFEGDAHAPGPVTGEEAARLSSPASLAGAPGHVRADLPEWLAHGLGESLGENWIEEGEALAGRPPLDLRVNALKSSRERVMKSLARFNPQQAQAAPEAIRIAAGARDSRTPNVQSDEAFLKGWFEVQDLGSQLVSRLADAKAGEQVLDLCAGAGGKTLAMAAAMGNKGQIFAHDRDRSRLAPIYDRLKRAGVRNVQVRPPGERALDDLPGMMDRVLVDAPCTGSGTWRRRPDAKWKLTAEQLAARVAEQRAILEDALRYVRPGGALIYITCSILPEENGRQVADFLAAQPGFAMIPGAGLWHRVASGAARARFTPEGGLQLTPLTTGTDGFYFAALRKTAG
jgi:16S rRNA (cytosine967-C5)-methyltransferase